MDDLESVWDESTTNKKVNIKWIQIVHVSIFSASRQVNDIIVFKYWLEKMKMILRISHLEGGSNFITVAASRFLGCSVSASNI